jgi:predicted enzyme related to lactoylglutathione lyase
MNDVQYFEIQAEEPEKAVQFYATVFGWKCTQQPNMPIEYWRIETEGIRGAILKRPAPLPAPRTGTNAYVCSMQVADFDAVARRILANRGSVAMPKFAVPGRCWQGYFIDPQGNTFGTFQVDPGAR